MTPPRAESQIEEIRHNLQKLRLRAMADALDAALEQAQITQSGYAAFLDGLLRTQLLVDASAAVDRRTKAAHFPAAKTFDSFDWAFQPGLNVPLAKDLMGLGFIRQGRPVLLLGRPGTGKSHLSVAYGHLACKAGFRVEFVTAKQLLLGLYADLVDATVDKTIAALGRLDLLIIDDIRAIAPARPEYASLFYDLIVARNGKATIVSSNLSIDEWGDILGNRTLTASLADRLMERAHVINIKRGKSYRTEGPDAPPPSDRPAGLTGTET
jgi:DNA replication protein DnaC